MRDRVPEAAGALAAFPAVPPGEEAATTDMILGRKPLWQPLVPAPGGRWQPHELGWDTAKGEWFNVFGNEGRKAGEWGHWTGRGMNWNSMCAHCHMTGYQKKYDATADTFASSWVEHGIGCIQCHGPVARGHGAKGAPPAPPPAERPPFFGDRRRMMETCAPCHARNEQLTLDFQPGDSYHDHYRITLPVEPRVYYPDGQQLDENFNWTSVLLSRMGHAGVTCLDCHDPHTTKTILPASNNLLCQQCHAPPGRQQPNGVRAPPIEPLAHSRHQEGSTGNQCVTCHMPTTPYMQRAPRHDHGWLKPDPLLTRELGIPNACNRCHADKTVEWAIEYADAWYGPKMESRQRARTRAVAAAQAVAPGSLEAVLRLLADEDIPAWRATYLLLLIPQLEGPGAEAILRAAQTAVAAADPLERSAAARVLSGHEPSRPLLRPLLKDPVRLVRLDAAWALSTELAAGSPERRELDAYLAVSLDQPAGRLRLGQDLANRGRLAEAETQIRLASGWDPFSPGIHDAHGFVLSGLGRSREAGARFYRSAQLQPNVPSAALRAALAYAEGGHLTEAENSLRLAIERDARFHRAWYNLGLLLSQTNRLPEAADALRRAEAIDRAVPDYPYALATILLRLGDRDGAAAAARRVLALQPGHPGARQVLATVAGPAGAAQPPR
jgi:predicted CXXCH cytochrome family protein